MTSELLLFLFLICLSGAFSGAEIALTSLSEAKVRAIQNDKKFASKAIVKLKKYPHKLLITILIGNNLVNILTSVLATLWAANVFGNNSVALVTGVITFFILVFGEITPKTIAQKFALPFARIMAHPLRMLMWIFTPIILILEGMIHLMMRLLKLNPSLNSVSEEELLAMVDIGTQEGVIEEEEQELIENVLEFSETTVQEVMTMKKDMEVIDIDTPIRDAVKFFIAHSHSRIPVFKKNINNIVGIVTVHDILQLLNEPNGHRSLNDCNFSHPIVVPKTKSISKLFGEFQRRRQHMAIVVDEHGETVGLVTMEDILEEIVGDIADEQDREKKTIRSMGKNEWEVRGETTIEELNDALDIELEFPVHESVSLLILEELHRFPKLGEKITYQNLILQVDEMSKKKIEKVRITKLNRSEEDES
ncbi:HlyC/CorC family transporter [Candidatus Peregrinibacteria bacterium]|nr:MAG: HlyC/CorC family transporter [Candidatus Peregrinibacteria bacterium]